MASSAQRVAQVLMQRGDGVSAATKRGMVESGALPREDFVPQQPAAPVIAPSIPRDVTRQVNPAEYNQMLQQGKVPADKAYQEWIQRGRK